MTELRRPFSNWSKAFCSRPSLKKSKAKAAVGIHTNKFPQTQYFGTQLFYSANCPESEGIASAIRESVVGLLQPKNTREMKKADSNIFLLDKAKVPAVFVECGFLSNPQEAARLSDPAYQRAVAFTLYEGLLRNRAAE